MKPKDVVVIGAGIAGCAVALAIAKRNIPVTIMTSSFDQRIYHGHFTKLESLEEKLRGLKDSYRHAGCARAADQLVNCSRASIDELLESHLLVDRSGNVDLHRSLQEQLRQMPHVEWAAQHTVVELLTLEQHSNQISDIYKKPTCFGVHAYNYESNQVTPILAKEVILATGGASSLFPYSTHALSAKGSGFAMAHRAGARLVSMEDIRFHPLALFDKNKPCVPLTTQLLKEGGILHISPNVPLEKVNLEQGLAYQLYAELCKNHAEHLWLDLTLLDPLFIKEKYPAVDAWCLNYGFNIAKDLIPVVPVAQYTGGGVAVDQFGRTNVQRLRAIGEVACTGLLYDTQDEAMGVLESLTWAVSCAEDVLKQVTKFSYYFPEVRPWNRLLESSPPHLAKEDWKLLQKIMWYYVGIIRDPARLKRGCALLHHLKTANEAEGESTFSIERMDLNDALQTSILIAESALHQALHGARSVNQPILLEYSEK